MLEKLRAKRDNHEGGFTLIELLIVIVILGVLATVVIFSVGGITNNSAAAACKADAASINTAAEAFYAQNGAAAANMYALVTPGALLKADGTITAAAPTVKTGKGYTLVWVGGAAAGTEGLAGGVDAGAAVDKTVGGPGGGCLGL